MVTVNADSTGFLQQVQNLLLILLGKNIDTAWRIIKVIRHIRTALTHQAYLIGFNTRQKDPIRQLKFHNKVVQPRQRTGILHIQVHLEVAVFYQFKRRSDLHTVGIGSDNIMAHHNRTVEPLTHIKLHRVGTVVNCRLDCLQRIVRCAIAARMSTDGKAVHKGQRFIIVCFGKGIHRYTRHHCHRGDKGKHLIRKAFCPQRRHIPF